MNTKKIENGSTPKGGKDNTRVVLTAAGAVAVGAGAGSVITDLLNDKEKPEEKKEEETNNSQEHQNEGSNTSEAQQQAQQAQQAQQEQQAQQTQQAQQQASNSTQPTPIATDNNGGGSSSTGGGSSNSNSANNNGGSTNNGGGSSNEDVDAEALAVAERLVGTDEIDPDDIDSLVNVNFEEADILYTEDGSEIPVAVVTTPDGGEFMLADIDGDRVYDVVYDQFGNPVSGVQAGLNTSDAELALNEGYIAINENDPVFDDDPDPDIIPLDGSDNSELADVEETDNDDEILADIFEDEDETDDDDEILADIFEDEEETDDEEDSDDDGPDLGLAYEDDSDLSSDLLDA